MKLDFPREDMPAQMVEHHYKFMMDMHMNYEKMHIDREFSYMKYADIFVLAAFGLMLMDSKGTASNYLLGIVVAGIGTLLVLAMNMIFLSSNIDLKRTCYAEEGRLIEEKYRSIVNFHYFRAVNAAKTARYRASLFSRLFPFVFVGAFTIWAGVSLSMKIGTHFASLIGIFSGVILLASAFFLGRIIKKWQLLPDLEK